MSKRADRSTYGVNGISIFSPFCPERSLPSPEVFVPPDEITDEEVEYYQMSEEDMEMLTRLIALEQEMLLCPEAAGLPISYHAADVLARIRVDDKIDHQIAKTPQVLVKLQYSSWDHGGSYINTKTEDLQGSFPLMLLYGRKHGK
ncbi:unnamed protein product [Dibothriocephalus latus]|uniref:Uncharacterized protein n=1 Tax=Dibothriocephalus latus TaxID=60516 RepID=A0A3P7NNU2_DIBLA|nr:unnamed protein product [Dibothriocephalus latus]